MLVKAGMVPTRSEGRRAIEPVTYTHLIRYFTSGAGYMVTGFITDSNGNIRHFDETTGLMTRGWLTDTDEYKYYFCLLYTSQDQTGSKSFRAAGRHTDRRQPHRSRSHPVFRQNLQ